MITQTASQSSVGFRNKTIQINIQAEYRNHQLYLASIGSALSRRKKYIIEVELEQLK
jgi:hypothetical protein